MNKNALLLFVAHIMTFSISAQSQSDSLLKAGKIYLETYEFQYALPLIEQSAQLGNPEAQFHYAKFYENRIEMKSGNDQAFRWMNNAASAGYIPAMLTLAQYYKDGFGTDQNFDSCYAWISQCAEQSIECMSIQINMLEQGIGCVKNTEQAFELSEILAARMDSKNENDYLFVASARLGLALDYYHQQDYQTAYMYFLMYNEIKYVFLYTEQQKHFEQIKFIQEQLTEKEQNIAIMQATNILQAYALMNDANLLELDF